MHGNPRMYEAQVARLEACGLAVGEKFHSREFAEDAVFSAARAFQALTAHDLQQKLPGLGNRRCFAILSDGVPVGGASLGSGRGFGGSL